MRTRAGFGSVVWATRRRRHTGILFVLYGGGGVSFIVFMHFYCLFIFKGQRRRRQDLRPVFSTHTRLVIIVVVVAVANVIWQMFAKWFLLIFFHNPFSTTSGNYFIHHICKVSNKIKMKIRVKNTHHPASVAI